DADGAPHAVRDGGDRATVGGQADPHREVHEAQHEDGGHHRHPHELVGELRTHRRRRRDASGAEHERRGDEGGPEPTGGAPAGGRGGLRPWKPFSPRWARTYGALRSSVRRLDRARDAAPGTYPRRRSRMPAATVASAAKLRSRLAASVLALNPATSARDSRATDAAQASTVKSSATTPSRCSVTTRAISGLGPTATASRAWTKSKS